MDAGRARKLLTQIEAFETKVRTSQDSFLGQKLKDFLPELKSKSDVDYVDSVATLRKLVKKKSDEIDSITETSNYNDNKIVVYFKWFLDFHSYLKTLKESFDGRVHKHLLQYFYDSPYASSPDKSIPSTESSGYASSLERQISLISLTSSSGSHHDIHPALKDVYQEFIKLSAGVDEERINKLAERLFVTSRQLQRLLREDIPIRQLILSSYQSKHNETTDDGNDIVILLEKIFKIFAASAKQAKQWVQLDTVKSVHLHLARQRFKEMHKTLTARIRELDGIIDGIQREIDNESEGLHKLVKREERASDINSKLFEMDDNIVQREDELKNTEMELAAIKSQLHKIDKNDYQERKRLETELEASKMQVDNIARDIEAKKFCKRLLEEDLQVEMQIKPSMIRFTNSVQEKCETLETNLSKHRRERAALLDFIEKLRGERQRVESEILRQAMLISSLDHDIAKHRPSIVPPLSPSLDSPPPKGRFIDLSSSRSMESA